MSKQVILTLSEGDFERGFAVMLRIQDDTDGTLKDVYQTTGKLPPYANMDRIFCEWQSSFHKKIKQPDNISSEKYRGRPVGVKKFHVRSDLKHAANSLASEINNWLNTGDTSWRGIREGILKSLNENEEIRFIIQTENMMLRQLPWQTWELFTRYYPGAEIGLSPTEAQSLTISRRKEPGIRILAVLGKSESIDIDFDVKILNSLCSQGAFIEFLNKPTKQELLDRFWNGVGWDIFFFAGHSESINGAIGNIHINNNEVIEIEELKNAMRTAIEQGLQMAIFNSCDGLGLANQLGKLHLPHSVVMREPVPDQVAQVFLQDFLTAYAEGASFYSSVHKARGKLEDTWSKEYPGVNWLPIIYQNSTMTQPRWHELKKKRTSKKKITPPKLKRKWILLIGIILILMMLALTYKEIISYARGVIFNMSLKEWTEPVTGIEFVRIPGGCYEMGCDSKRDPNCPSCETPLHKVCLERFWIGKYEVTQGQWEKLMENNPSASKDINQPVEMVGWEDAQQFIKKLKKKSNSIYRLPTEAEWEYVCKSTESFISDREDGAGIYGIKEKIGEWCEDTYIPEAYSTHELDNPVISDISGKSKVVRGINPVNLKTQRCTFRSGRPPDRQTSNVGFRIVRLE